jgi:hypothetical protein
MVIYYEKAKYLSNDFFHHIDIEKGISPQQSQAVQPPAIEPARATNLRTSLPPAAAAAPLESRTSRV